jgi:hypothetical protein
MICSLLPLPLLLLTPPQDTTPGDWVRALPPAEVHVDADRHEITIDLGPVDVPTSMHHESMASMAMPGMNMSEQHAHNPVYPPVMAVDLPLSGWMSGFRIELVDAEGHALPSDLLHHYNLIDPNHRELFLPISRRVLAAGSETGAIRMARWLFGAPFTKGERLVANAMLHNPTMRSYTGVRTRLVLTYTDEGHWYPLLRAYPWQLDVAFPVGDKSFDLAPGRSERSYEASPAIAGKIVGIGGHVHDHADSLVMRDLTTGKDVWSARPIVDSTGHVVGMPQKKFVGLTGVGVGIVPERRYRVTVYYTNPTGLRLEDGGMGVVAGLFKPAKGATWPIADATDPLYVRDLRHYLRIAPSPSVAVGSSSVVPTTP